MTLPVNQQRVGIEEKPDRAETIRALRRLCQTTSRTFSSYVADSTRISTGIPALDALLPGRGLQPGWLVEWLSPVEGCGVTVLALQGVRAALQRQGAWSVVDETGEFYPPAVQGWGVSLERMLWLRPSSLGDAAWAVEQSLRCPAVGLTWFQAERMTDRVLRRWKIAAEMGGGVGVLFRPAKAARTASWADVRWLVHPQPLRATPLGRRIRVELLSCRGEYRTGDWVELEVCDATGDVRLVSTLAGAASALHSVSKIA
ncbi:ImuA family protein [Schlesneria sp.]|uniref:ImuA family protein n=1 Tax=Schlesneria sp. TaxID=2762018 RepID=UPI002EE26A09